MNQKQINICLCIMIFSLLLSLLCYYSITLPNENKSKKLYKTDFLQYQLNNLNPKFDYINGLWLLFAGNFFIFLLLLLELPSFEDIYKKIKKELKIRKYL